MKRLVCSLAMLVFFVGCGSTPTDSEAGRPVTGPIPEGIYDGDITTRVRTSLSGVPFDDVTTTEPYTEFVDSHGIPLIQPGGELPTEGLILDTDVQSYTSRATIDSVFVAGNRVIIGYSGVIEISGVAIGGSGTWTYVYEPPSTLRFHEKFSAISDVAPNGGVLTLTVDSTATLTRE